ncbi:MAG: pyridoxine 5'-phosphate synthase [Deltaproteobacteria bacterium]|nr:pyridoxine 5'-phosphate synthase [Deltaproteobacteria bacterium]
MTVRLHVNIDHVATLRRLRDTRYPDLVTAARTCLGAGARGITMHLREDRRHVTDADVDAVRKVVADSGAVFNLEMALTEEMVSIASRLRPDVATLVPERREERTTEGGLDVALGERAVTAAAARLASAGIRVSLFVNPDFAQIEAAARTGARTVELHTGEYCGATDGAEKARELARLAAAAQRAGALGLEVAAGHGLYYDDVGPVAAITEVVELNIGHGIVCRAVEVGLEKAVREMVAAMGPR